MGQRRMFSKTITESGRFLKMPPSSQALYFQLGMNADDDGVVEAFKVMKLTNSNDDDLKVLVSKNFIKILNDDLVAFVMDWSEHNLIRADRKIDSIYKNLLLQMVPEAEILEPKPRADTQKLTGGQPVDVQWTAQDKISKDKVSKENTIPALSAEEEKLIADLIFSFKDVNPNYKTLFSRNPQRTAVKRMLAEHSEDKLRKIIAYLPKNNATEFAPTITTPVELENKMGALMASVQKIKSKNSVIGIAI